MIYWGNFGAGLCCNVSAVQDASGASAFPLCRCVVYQQEGFGMGIGWNSTMQKAKLLYSFGIFGVSTLDSKDFAWLKPCTQWLDWLLGGSFILCLKNHSYPNPFGSLLTLSQQSTNGLVTGKSENWTPCFYFSIYSSIFIYFHIFPHYFTSIFHDFPSRTTRSFWSPGGFTRPLHWVLAVLKGWGARGVRGSVGCPAWVQ
jgi:hypothetical protein